LNAIIRQNLNIWGVVNADVVPIPFLRQITLVNASVMPLLSKKLCHHRAARVDVTQTPASAHIVAMFDPPVEMTHRSPSQCGVDAIKGDIMNPRNVFGVQYLT